MGTAEVRSALFCVLMSPNVGVRAAQPKPTSYFLAFIGIMIHYAPKCAHS
jgi:hypothetical protein